MQPTSDRRGFDWRRAAFTVCVKALFATAFLIVVLWVMLGGCSKNPATFTPAPRAIDPASTVAGDGSAWVTASPATRFVASVAPTGSMEPFINEHSLLLCVRYVGQPLRNGAVAIYHYSDAKPRVVHVVSDQTADSVYFSGYANHDSDGWRPKSAIEGFVVGQLYLP